MKRILLSLTLVAALLTGAVSARPTAAQALECPKDTGFIYADGTGDQEVGVYTIPPSANNVTLTLAADANVALAKIRVNLLTSESERFPSTVQENNDNGIGNNSGAKISATYGSGTTVRAIVAADPYMSIAGGWLPIRWSITSSGGVCSPDKAVAVFR